MAARVGAPLGHDYAMISLSDRLKPWEVVERRLAAVADADMAIALYNPASRSRTWQVEAARDLLLKYRDPSTPVVVGRDVDGPEESVRVVRARRPGAGRGRHAHPAHRRVVEHAVARRRHGLHAAAPRLTQSPANGTQFQSSSVRPRPTRRPHVGHNISYGRHVLVAGVPAGHHPAVLTPAQAQPPLVTLAHAG